MAELRRVREGDVVRVDIRGRVFYAVAGARDADGGLKITPIDSRVAHYRATSRQILDVYRKLPRPKSRAA